MSNRNFEAQPIHLLAGDVTKAMDEFAEREGKVMHFVLVVQDPNGMRTAVMSNAPALVASVMLVEAITKVAENSEHLPDKTKASMATQAERGPIQ